MKGATVFSPKASLYFHQRCHCTFIKGSTIHQMRHCIFTKGSTIHQMCHCTFIKGSTIHQMRHCIFTKGSTIHQMCHCIFIKGSTIHQMCHCIFIKGSTVFSQASITILVTVEGQQNAELKTTRSRDPGQLQKAHLKPPAWPKDRPIIPAIRQHTQRLCTHLRSWSCRLLQRHTGSCLRSLTLLQHSGYHA